MELSSIVYYLSVFGDIVYNSKATALAGSRRLFSWVMCCEQIEFPSPQFLSSLPEQNSLPNVASHFIADV